MLAEAQAQAIEREYWLGIAPTRSESFSQYSSLMGAIIGVTENMRRHPDPRLLRMSIHANRDTDPQPLIDFLDGLGEGDKIIAVPFNSVSESGYDLEPTMSKEAIRMMYSFNYGRNPKAQKRTP